MGPRPTFLESGRRQSQNLFKFELAQEIVQPGLKCARAPVITIFQLGVDCALALQNLADSVSESRPTMQRKKPGPKKSPEARRLDRLRAERLEMESERIKGELVSMKEVEEMAALTRAEFGRMLADSPELKQKAWAAIDQVMSELRSRRPKVASLHRRNGGALMHQFGSRAAFGACLRQRWASKN
jgi:hypothetical protein